MIRILHSSILRKSGVKHGFTERSGGVSPAPMDSLNTKVSLLVPDRVANVSENLEKILKEGGLTNSMFTLLYLKGRSNVTQVNIVDGLQTLYGFDGAVTQLRGSTLAMTVADCLPVLLMDQRAGVIGISHAGWKGSADKITPKVVEQMVSLGAEPSKIVAAIGPGICGKCYEVGPEVAERFDVEYLDQQENGKYLLNLRAVNVAQLQEQGVTRIDHLDICTYENNKRFFSARREGKTGRFLAYIKLPPA